MNSLILAYLVFWLFTLLFVCWVRSFHRLKVWWNYTCRSQDLSSRPSMSLLYSTTQHPFLHQVKDFDRGIHYILAEAGFMTSHCLRSPLMSLYRPRPYKTPTSSISQPDGQRPTLDLQMDMALITLWWLRRLQLLTVAGIDWLVAKSWPLKISACRGESWSISKGRQYKVQKTFPKKWAEYQCVQRAIYMSIEECKNICGINNLITTW